ncbi:hypothetical protein CN135_24490 [Sinorhizobium meliloti]|nr:hypothetical protein CN135_24490 [Sinorhizobium meliloti]
MRGRIDHRNTEIEEEPIYHLSAKRQDEFLLAATAQNLRRLAKLRPGRECPRECSNKFANP